MTTQSDTRRARPRPPIVRKRSVQTNADEAPKQAAQEAAAPAPAPAASAPAPAQRAVTSSQRPARSKQPQRYDTQFIPFWFVGRVVQCAVWLSCFLSFTGTTIGNIGLFGGDLAQAAQGSSYFTSPAFLVPLAPSIPYQFVVQMFQFYAARKYGQSSWQYRATLAFSVIPSCWTYGWVCVPWVWHMAAIWWGTVWLVRIPTVAILLILAVIVIVLNDMIQEWILVKREG